MEKITIGMLLDKKLITKRTKIKISIENLKEIHLVKPLSKAKFKATVSELEKRGMFK